VDEFSRPDFFFRIVSQQFLFSTHFNAKRDMEETREAGLVRLLREHHGHAAFRPLQLEAMQATLRGEDVVLSLPTGGGKSAVFQLPSVLQSKITVVVTPLLSLAQDQVRSCDALDIEAACWSSETPEPRKEMVLRELLADEDACTLRLLYTTPESLQSPRLLEALAEAHARARLCSLAVDEAHMVCEWGHDFRPAYLQLAQVRDALPNLPVLAATATATPQVRDGIVDLLRLRPPRVLVASFNRPNIALAVRFKELVGDGSQAAVVADVAAFIRARPGQRGIVYARLRASCDAVAAALRDAGVEASAYHAAMDAPRRARTQRDWTEGGIDVVVATVAFGVGIDVPDVRFVLHFDAPASLEGYSQECGRSGRDGQPADSVLWVSNDDFLRSAAMERGERRGATAAVAAWAQNAACRRRALLAHFGERHGACDTAAGEQLCDFCADGRAVRAALAAVERKLEAAAVKAQQAAEAELGDRGDPYERCAPATAGRPQPARPAPAAPALRAVNGAARGPLLKPVIPSKRAPAALPPLPEPPAEQATPEAAPAPRASQPSGGDPAAAAAAAFKRPRQAAFQPPRRINPGP
jgi:RecQ family ATP-dependent DNA helicase